MSIFDLIAVLAVIATGGVLVGLALIATSIHTEERRMSLRAAPTTRTQAATRRFVGAWSRTDDLVGR